MLLPDVTVNCKPQNNLASKNQNTNADTKISTNNQISDKGKTEKPDHMGNKSKSSKMSTRTSRTVIINKNSALHIATYGNSLTGGKINSSIKKNDGNGVSKVVNTTKNSSIVNVKQSSNNSTFSNVRSASTCVTNTVHENLTKHSKDYASKKFTSETGSSIKTYPVKLDYKELISVNSSDYKSRNSGSSMTTGMPLRFSAQQSTITTSVFYRENHTPSSTYMQSNITGSQKSDSNVAFAVARKALEQQQNSMPKMAPINFPPLRAPQSIVNVRHPLLTDARAKYVNEKVVGGPTGGGGVKSKLNSMNSLQSGNIKELPDHTGHSQATFHGYGTSPIAAGIPNVQNLNNLSNAVTANISPYPDSFPQPTIASVLFSDTAAQFPQSPPFNTQIGQLNHQYQTYDPGSFATTPVNVNPVIPQFSAENSIPYPQYENPPQFVQPNHYPTADMTNSQYQYQAAAASVGQIQDSSMFIQSPIAVADQYAASNYARAVRTELIPRALRRPPRFNK